MFVIKAPGSFGPVEDMAFTLYAMECEGEFDDEEEEGEED